MRHPGSPVCLEDDQIGTDFICDPYHRFGEKTLSRRCGVKLVRDTSQMLGGDFLKPGAGLFLFRRVRVLADLELSDSAKRRGHMEQMQGCAVMNRDLLGKFERRTRQVVELDRSQD